MNSDLPVPFASSHSLMLTRRVAILQLLGAQQARQQAQDGAGSRQAQHVERQALGLLAAVLSASRGTRLS